MAENGHSVTDQRLDTTDLWERVYQLLKASLIAREFRPNQKLRLDKLAKDLGVSRTPLRDALNRLALEGLVRLVPRRGTYVVALQRAEIEDLWAVREMIEVWAAERVLNATPAHLAAVLGTMQAVLKRYEQAGAELATGVAQLHDLDPQLHLTLVRGASSQRVEEIWNSMHAPMLTIDNYLAKIITPASFQATVREHRAILDALRRQDRAQVRTAIGTHLQRARDRALALVDASPQGL